MLSKEAQDLLIRARAIIAQRYGWSRSNWITRRGPNKVACCASGAILLASDENSRGREDRCRFNTDPVAGEALKALAEAIPEDQIIVGLLTPINSSFPVPARLRAEAKVIEFNDSSNDKRRVLRAFDRAIGKGER